MARFNLCTLQLLCKDYYTLRPFHPDEQIATNIVLATVSAGTDNGAKSGRVDK